MEIGDFATFHDGGLQGGMRTTLISKAMASTRQRDMVALLSYLEDYGFNQLNAKILQEKLSGDEMMKLVFSYPGDFRGKDVYVLYLEDKIRNLGSISYFGSWDFNQNKSDPMGYVELNCSAMVNNIMTCRDGIIDLNRGIMQDDEGSVLFRRALFVNNGYVVDQRDFGHVDGYSLQVLARDNQVKMVLVADERLFRSNFNQQYLLGNYDKRYFEEVYNNFPVVRVLKVKSAKPLAQGTAQ
jgi:dolichyl-diphosphooligosaccharide--protein glycosyltransferase